MYIYAYNKQAHYHQNIQNRTRLVFHIDWISAKYNRAHKECDEGPFSSFLFLIRDRLKIKTSNWYRVSHLRLV